MMQARELKQRLRAGETVAGYMCLIPSAVSVQAIAAAGASWVIIDLEHGPIGPESLHAMIAATAGTACAPLVRVPKGDEVWVKRALDAGADGICFPLVNTAEDAANCVALTRYPPGGKRGWGPFVGHARWGTSLFGYLAERGESTVVMITIETAEAVRNIDAICAVEGIDCMVVGSFDLTTDLGVSGQFDAPAFKEAMARIERAVFAAGLPLGGAALNAEQTRALMARGYRLLLHGFDVLMLGQLVRQTTEWRR
jgi:4-hydroxy-2-oxoheptanedioate aldolase